MASTKYNLPIEQACLNPSFEKEVLRNAIPSHIQDTHTQFFFFLQKYFEYLKQDNNAFSKIKSIQGARDPVVSQYKTSLLKEFGENFPNITSITDDILLKILKMFYVSKGNENSIIAYFRIFLNDQRAFVVYPKENMLRTDDGIWDDANNVYVSFQGFLDESGMVLQDDDYYQIYSYVVKSGQSVNKWGPKFEEAVHPTGWKFFGEIELVSLALFEIGDLSPTIVPGSQVPVEQPVVLTSEAFHEELAFIQQLELVWNPTAEFTYDSLDLGYNILNNQGLTISDLADFTIEELTTIAVDTDIRRGATIIIT